MDLISLDQDDCFQDVLRDDSEDLVWDKVWFAVFLVAQSKYGSHCSFLHDENVFNVCGNATLIQTLLFHTAGVMLRENSRLSEMMFQLILLSANDDNFLQTWSAEDSFLHRLPIWYSLISFLQTIITKNLVDSSVGIFKLLQPSSGPSVIRGKVDCLVFITVMCNFRDLHCLVPSFVQRFCYQCVVVLLTHCRCNQCVLSSANSIHFKSWLNLTGSVFK